MNYFVYIDVYKYIIFKLTYARDASAKPINARVIWQSFKTRRYILYYIIISSALQTPLFVESNKRVRRNRSRWFFFTRIIFYSSLRGATVAEKTLKINYYTLQHTCLHPTATTCGSQKITVQIYCTHVRSLVLKSV